MGPCKGVGGGGGGRVRWGGGGELWENMLYVGL